MSQPGANSSPSAPSMDTTPVPVTVLQSQLRGLPVAERLRLSLFVMLLGCGYLAGFLYIQLTTVPEGQAPNPAKMPAWIALKYHGDPTPLLIRMIEPGGKMRKYMKDPDKDLPVIQDWAARGMPEGEAELQKLHLIFDKTGPTGKSCLECHSRLNADGDPAEMARAPLESIDDIKNAMRTGGMSVNDLARLSHFHLIGMSLMALGFTWVWMKTAFRRPWRSIFMVLPFVAIFCDVGGWWLTWLHPLGAYVVLLGGGLYGLSSLVLTLGPLYDMWCRRCSVAPAGS